jgi:hypothetical protein
MPHERDQEPHRRHRSEPQTPIPLTPELADFLSTQPGIICLTHGSDQGTLYLVKAPAREIESLRGTFPIRFRHELHQHPAAPVIRTVSTLYDVPDRPLRLETFTNVGDAMQREDYARLATQEELLMLFYDEQLRHRLSKRIPHPNREALVAVFTRAQELAAAIPATRFDFDRAKAAVMERTRL